ncbi:hypothetical protein BJF78_27825 [Pseudonocardia sp. CNS-139]|nr:hypothetical protein BJF78_27825 [Pseudonocardia sp. CNS-139]
MRRPSTYSFAGVDTLAPPVAPVRGPRASLWTLRITLTAFTAAVLAQPVLAGLFLDGDVDAITAHGLNATFLNLGTLVLVGVTPAYAFGGRGARWPVLASVVLFLAVTLQAVAGYARWLWLHVPLGVGIVAGCVLLTIWVWTPAAARPRGTR